MRAIRQITFALMVTIPSLSATTVLAQEAVYEVPGILAWTTAKTYGFTFAPEARSGESVSRPLDGMNTRLTRTVTAFVAPKTYTIGQVVGGQPSVNSGDRNTTFKMFGGRTLQPGWTVKTVDLGGAATLRKLVLNGPANADWKDAFSAPLRKDYVINGTAAWNAARKYGFTFTPVDEPGGHVNTRISVPADGVFTTLTYEARGLSLNDRCLQLVTSSGSHCIIGQVAGGNISVPRAPSGDASSSIPFEMFGSKRLSPGWKVKSVSTSNGTWRKQAGVGTDDLSFILVVTSYADKPAYAIVQSVTIEGPSNAASFEDAFRNARTPD
ncbi:MAG: hypothetical protein ACSLFK_10995 [Gemmatimonadaceae bacterium]